MDHAFDHRESCAFLAGLHGDPLAATANETSAWLLLEHAGPWGKNALRDSDLDPSVVAEFERRLADTGARVQLMAPPVGERPQWTYIASDPREGTPWLVRLPTAAPRDLLELDFGAVVAGRIPADADPVDEPLYVVCNNERSDPCCGRAGPPVHAAAQRRLGARCRATTHLGGHKYAANMIVYPYASNYGRLGPVSVLDVIDATEAGQIHLGQYRGRPAYTIPEQAAEHMLRETQALTGLADVRLATPAVDLGDECHRAGFTVNDGKRYDVVVRGTKRGPARLQSCTDTKPGVPVVWSLETIKEAVDVDV
ncbi:MAG TPA: sucrase ferredoxin [Candidatus Limnocylindrales bacterium]|nr:sucrase ferredoxin [Candidatus Limnocylindrales bacterium]